MAAAACPAASHHALAASSCRCHRCARRPFARSAAGGDARDTTGARVCFRYRRPRCRRTSLGCVPRRWGVGAHIHQGFSQACNPPSSARSPAPSGSVQTIWPSAAFPRRADRGAKLCREGGQATRAAAVPLCKRPGVPRVLVTRMPGAAYAIIPLSPGIDYPMSYVTC